MRGAYRRIARDVVGAVPPNGSVLDVGTGPGRLLTEIASLRADVRITGIDPASDMIDAARRNLAWAGERASAEVADVVDLPFADGTFDVVVSSLSLHHWADPIRGGAEVARVRRPGGQIRIYDLRSAPFAELHTAVTGQQRPVELSRFPVTPLPVPALRRLVL
jgi:ubiquinone/menaquinone biosynthesis C-methylase UbiE